MAEEIGPDTSLPPSSPDAGVVLPAEQVFLPDTPSAPPLLRTRPPGPGLPESLLWMVGVLPAQLAGMLAIMAVVFVTRCLESDRISMADLFQDYFKELENQLGLLIGGGQFGMLIYALGGVALRLRPRPFRRLGIQLPSFGHMLLVTLLVLPLSLLCTELMKVLFEVFPSSYEKYMEAFKGMEQAPLSQLILVMAVLPALGEELLCRGLIGTGLIARWGVAAGVLITSILFGVMHITPAHVIAVIPLGIALHYVYLTTRSFWAPVALHFMNNAFAAYMLKYGKDLSLGRLMDGEGMLPGELLIVSATVVVAVLLLLWQTRVRSQPAVVATDDPGHLVLENLTPHVAVKVTSQRTLTLLLAGGLFNLFGFIITVWRLAQGM